MAEPKEKLSKSLEVLKELQDENGIAVIKSNEISRTHKDRLLRNGFIQEVMKGWYISRRPNDKSGESTFWYTSFWHFCSVYLNHRFGEEWCVSPEQSVSILSGNWTVPGQLIVRSPKAQNNVTSLLFNTSIVDTATGKMPPKELIMTKNGVKVFTAVAALVYCSENYFRNSPTDVRILLSTFRDASDLLRLLLEGGNSRIAGRLAGAFRNIGSDRIADEIIKTMKAADFDAREYDPFTEKVNLSLTHHNVSPYVNRIKVMWREMREVVLSHFPDPPGLPGDKEKYMKNVNEFYKTDAYHSLSIEGYRVSPELIEKVAKGNWNPDKNEEDKELKNALAARGYYLAYEAVKKSILKVISGENSGAAAEQEHTDWYREMFTPNVTAGLIERTDLAGYRNGPVFISQSSHIPMSSEGARDAMPSLFELLINEPEPAVRAVLGHFIFVYIHPYVDGNGRMARFLMNLMLASGGYPWTVIPIEKREDYMSALEKASINQNIEDFTKFIARLVSAGIKGQPEVKPI